MGLWAVVCRDKATKQTVKTFYFMSFMRSQNFYKNQNNSEESKFEWYVEAIKVIV